MGENEKVSMDYEKECARLNAYYQNELDEKDKEYSNLIQSQQNEINWLKAVISNILHI